MFGYDTNHKGYRLWCLKTSILIIVRRVVFYENTFPFQSTKETTYLPVSAAIPTSVIRITNEIGQDPFASGQAPSDQALAHPNPRGDQQSADPSDDQLSEMSDDQMDVDDTVITNIVHRKSIRGQKRPPPTSVPRPHKKPKWLREYSCFCFATYSDTCGVTSSHYLSAISRSDCEHWIREILLDADWYTR